MASLIEQAALRLEQLRQAGIHIPEIETPGSAAPVESPAAAQTALPGAPWAAAFGATAVAEAPLRGVSTHLPPAIPAVVAPAPLALPDESPDALQHSRLVEINLAALAAAGIVTPNSPRSHMADQYRVIKRPLIANAMGRGAATVAHGNLIMVTSALPGEGKSFSSINLAFGAEARFENYAISEGEANSYIGGDLKKSVPAAPLLISGPANGTALALPGSQVFPGFQKTDAIDKSRTSQSLYVDVESEIGRLLVDLAGRFENYSDFGSTVNGKVAARYTILEGINLRGAISTGFRAPSLHQRYFQNTSTQFVSGNPSNTLTVNNENDIARKFIGVDALRPETSVNMTVGATAKFGRFSATIDAYQIDITNRIVYSGAFSRALLGFTATDYVGVNNVNFFANAANTRTRGVDIVLNQRLNIGKGLLTLTGAVNFNRNEVTGINSTPLIDDPKQNETSGRSPDQWFRTLLFDRQQRSRIEVFQPQNKLNLSASYSIGKFDITARTVRFGEIKYVHNVDPTVKKADGTYWNTQFARDADGNASIDQTFNPVWITDLVLGYRLNKMLNISIGANNIFDVYPDQIYIDPRNAQGSIDYNSGRDASNRDRLLYQPNQGGYNGRFLFGRVTVSL